MIRRSTPRAGIQRTGNGASPVARFGGRAPGSRCGSAGRSFWMRWARACCAA